METSIYEADPFTEKRAGLLATINTDYRFEKGDEIFFDRGERPLKVRIIKVWLHVQDGGRLSREVLALKL